MSNATYELWCLVRGDNTPFPVIISPTNSIGALKQYIKKEREYTLFERVDASSLDLWQVDVDIYGVVGDITEGKYHFDTDNKEPLDPYKKFSQIWPQPSGGQLHIYVTSRSILGSLTLVQMPNEPIDHFQSLRVYEDIFVKVKTWSMFEQSDIARNRIQDTKFVPSFVKTFEQKLVRKPRLRSSMRSSLQRFDISESCFELPEDSIVEDEPLGEPRYAERLEVLHTAYYVSLYDWEKSWEPEGVDNCPLKGHVADTMFFHPLVRTPHNRTATVLLNKSWPITVVVKREGVHPNEEPRKYNPHSDFLISHSSLPRLLVEVNSTSVDWWPTDLIRMLTTGAFIVRFANRFSEAFCKEKNFVLCAIFIWDNGKATRYTLFQQQAQSDETVYYKATALSLRDSAGRIEFVRHLYNLLCVESDPAEAEDTQSAVSRLNEKIKRLPLKSMYTKVDKNGRKRPRGDDGNHTGTGEGGDRAQLRTHGYEVKPDVVVDASGGEWGPLFKKPDHILTVYRPMDSNKEFIAKKVREDSNELEMLRILDSFPLKSDHVISLIDSFYGWAILPKMVTVKDYVEFAPDLSESEVSQICLGLIKGVAYLHEHRIAHRDIKPDNLLLDKNLCLKIIDFDIAMRVEDEDEEVDDQCGTKDWMAPEVEKNLRHSPIKADRWACGQALLFLLSNFGKEDEPLRAFARALLEHNPMHRPSLLEWRSYLAPPCSDVGTVWDFDARKALRTQQDPVEVDGENTKPPNAKKRRLGGSQASTLCMGSENVMTGCVTALH